MVPVCSLAEMQPEASNSAGTGTADFRYTPDGKVFQQDATTHTASFDPRGYEVTDYAGSTIERHELGPIIVVRENGVNTVRGILRDRLGSLVTMLESLESGGNFVTYRSYDAFGKTRGGNFTHRLNGTFNFLPHSLHGFTDHNHVDDVWLLHMNGRVYDYQLGRFLSPDPLIQFPANSQSLNPYSYILNNPLAGTDPSGYAACMGAPSEGETCTATETPTGSHIAKNYTIGASGGKFYVAAGGGAATTARVQGAMKANGAIGQGVTAAGGVKDQNAPAADKGTGKNAPAPYSNKYSMRDAEGNLRLTEAATTAILAATAIPYDPDSRTEAYQLGLSDGSLGARSSQGCEETTCPGFLEIPFEIHWHVNARRLTRGTTQEEANLTREFPGPGDGILPRHGVINVGVTPRGAVWALEGPDSNPSIRYLRHSNNPKIDKFVERYWSPGMKESEMIKKIRAYRP